MKQFKVYQASTWSKNSDYGFDFHSDNIAKQEGRENLHTLSVKNLSMFILEMGYRRVATFTADSLDEVFRMSNLGYGEENIERFGTMWSISVGDLIKDTTENKLYIVDPYDFRLLGQP